MKIAILFDRFGPYHIARIRGSAAYAKIYAVEGAPHRAIYDWATSELPEGLETSALTVNPGDELDVRLIERRLDETLATFQPDAFALPGWSNVITLTTLRWCYRNKIAAICMSETNDWDFKRTMLAEKVKSGIVAHYSAGLATNSSQVGYLKKLGIPAEAVFSGYNAVDNDYFRTTAAEWRQKNQVPAEIANKMPEAALGRYFLASARFIEKKNLIRLLDGYAEFRKHRTDDIADWPLVLLGDGELRGSIEAAIRRHGLQQHVHLPGFLQIDALPRYYGTAGAFVHASTTEQWGLVINEAMAAGMPVASSVRCGATQYLIEDGITGFSFDPFDVSDITRGLIALSELPAGSPLLAAAQARVDELSPDNFGANLARTAEAGFAHPAHPSFFDRRALDLAIRRTAWQERTK